MELRQLSYLVAVVEEGSFTKAAARVHVAQPAVSQQIAQLERELGEKLLDRSDRRVRLTPAGEAFLPHARAALESTAGGRDAVAALRGVLSGRLAVGTIPCPPPLFHDLLAEFRSRYPEVRLTVNTGSPESLTTDVSFGVLDAALIGVMNQRLPAGPSGQRLRPELASRTIAVEPLVVPLVVAVPPDHRLVGADHAELADIRGEPFVTLTRGHGLRAVVEAATAAAGFTLDIRTETDDLVTLTDLVGHGLGVALLPRSVVDRSRRPLVAVPLERPRLKRTQVLVWHRRRIPPVVKAFLDLAEVSDGAR
jgi:DNA-binding transcriptional LysR family regulator